MVEVSESTANRLEGLAEKQEVPLEEVQEKFREYYEDVESKSSEMPPESIEEIAFGSTASHLLKNRVSTDGVEMATIGGSVRNFGGSETFVGKALVDVNPNSDENTEFLSSIIASEDDVEIAEFYDAFSQVGNVVSGNFSVGEAHSDKFRILNTSEDTEIDVMTPSNRNEIVSKIRSVVPMTNIAEIADNLSQTERNDEGSVFPASFGVDIRRMHVTIYDGYKNPDKGVGTYTVRDNSVFDDDDIVESVVFNPEDQKDNENITPGMTCWTDPNMMEYGSETYCEFYGVLTENDDGIVQMNVDAIVPMGNETDFDGYEDSSSSETVDDSNVDSMEI